MRRYNPLGDADVATVVAAGWTPPYTYGVPLLEADMSEEQWLAARRGGVGASELASVLGVNGAYSSSFAVWWAKHNGWTSDRTMAQKIGTLMERTIGALFADEHPELFVTRPKHRLWRHPTLLWMLASPDFVACNAVGDVLPVECKSDEGPSWGATGDRIPLKHRIQLEAQCAVLGASSGYLVRVAGKKLSIYEVPGPSVEVVDYWDVVARAFMTSLETGLSPEPDGHKETEEALKRLYPSIADPTDPDVEVPPAVVPDQLADEYLAAQAAAKTAEVQLQALKNRMRFEMRDARLATRPDGTKVAERRIYKRDGYEVAPGMRDELRRCN